ncbi:HNH endonuclease domain protein [Selenomonas sp. CM52]|nr:HNH endonuclease domain protein [Selenomonas sp. CM52]
MCRERGHFVAATLVHHIKPLGSGGTHDESNLMSLCVSCHEKIHQRSRGDV